MKGNISANLDIMIQAIKKVGPMLRRDFGEIENLQIKSKGLNDFVTSSDIKSQNKIVEFLTENKPAFGIIAEEESLNLKGEDISHNFILDPIDGTYNFMHGFPYFCVSLGLMENDNYLAGVVYNPLNDELYYCEKGMGAFLDHPYKSKKLRTSKRIDLDTCLIAFYAAHDKSYTAKLRENLDKEVGHIRTTGAIALDLVYLASGNLDAVICHKPKLVDVAAGICLVKESGGKVEQVDGVFIAASTSELLDKIKRCLKK